MDVRKEECKFAVVIQYGGGHIYFESFHSTEDKAQLCANARAIYLSNQWRRWRRGAKPHIMVWECKSCGLQLVEAKDSGEEPATPV